MASNFKYDIIVLQASPPSDYQYVARVDSIICNTADGSKAVPWHEHQIPETWGQTQDEAYNKLENVIKEWISIQLK